MGTAKNRLGFPILWLTLAQQHRGTRLEYIIELDRELFLFLNGLHATWLDPVVLYATKTVFWIPLYLFFGYLIIRDKRWGALYVFLGIALAITMADQITSTLMKPFFARLRPSHDPTLGDMVHIVNGYRGGMYGFASGHAANSFALAIFLYGLYRKSRPAMGVVFLWALALSYTRIYLGVHYLGDIVVGAIVGLLCGSTVLWLVYRVRPNLIRA